MTKVRGTNGVGHGAAGWVDGGETAIKTPDPDELNSYLSREFTAVH